MLWLLLILVHEFNYCLQVHMSISTKLLPLNLNFDSLIEIPELVIDIVIRDFCDRISLAVITIFKVDFHKHELPVCNR